MRRVRDKLTAEIVELERSEKHAMEKYREMKTKLLDKEHECERYQISGKQKEEEITEIRAQYEKLSKERQNISDIVRQEFADRLVLAEEENRTLKRDAAELRARLMSEQGKHEAELNAVKHSTQAELETLHQK